MVINILSHGSTEFTEFKNITASSRTGFIRKGTNAAFSIWNNGLGLKVKYFRVLCVSVAYCFFTMICRCAQREGFIATMICRCAWWEGFIAIMICRCVWWEGFIATMICRRVWWEGFIVIYRI